MPIPKKASIRKTDFIFSKCFAEHKESWKNCTGCALHKKRRNVVLLRGKIPCDILFVGEAPGHSENVLGRPFVGDAGQLLDDLISVNLPNHLRCAFTNIVACIPLTEDGNKFKEPPIESIESCDTRLKEVIQLCKPRAVVTLGKVAADSYPLKWHRQLSPHRFLFKNLHHPAFILRSDVQYRGLLLQEFATKLINIGVELEELNAKDRVTTSKEKSRG